MPELSSADLALLDSLPTATIFLYSFMLIAILFGGIIYAFNISIYQTKASRKQAQLLKEANSELEEFAYRTSHDLRSPLSSAIRLIEYSDRFNKEGDPAKSSLLLNKAHESLVKLEVLVVDILSITRIQHAEEPLSSVNVEAIIQDSIHRMDYMEGFERIEINQSLRFTGSIQVKESRFRLIIENLISNAVKYADYKKPKSLLAITTHQQGKQLIVTFEDNGLGVPEHKQDALFKMFHRFHPKTSFGSGLGLYMIKKSADIINGMVVFKDMKTGSRFSLIVPINGESELEHEN